MKSKIPPDATIHHDTPLSVLKIRCDYDPDDPSDLSYNLNIYENYLKTFSQYIQTYTTGIHLPTKKHPSHFHIHIILNKSATEMKQIPPFKNKSYYFKELLKDLNIDYNKPGSSKCLGEPRPLYTDPTQPDIETAIHKTLRYTLKDQLPVHELCPYHTPDQLILMTRTAVEEYRFAKEQIQKNEAKDEARLTRWTTIRDHLDDLHMNTATPKAIFKAIVQFTINDNPPPTIQTIKSTTERYYLSNINEEELDILSEQQTKHLILESEEMKIAKSIIKKYS
tara:strand:+ start:53 stop:892 length:840 start_codon:yes stop_codon:yes gene_type:complete